MPQRAFLLLWVLVLPIAAIAGADSPAPAIVARWRGGELTHEVFRARYDPDERALERGGRELDEALCKGVFQEIYAELGLALGLGGSAELAAELASWRERNLAAAWRRAHQPDFSAVATPEAVRALYAERAESTYRSGGQADLETLFLKCGVRPAERAACREQATRLDVRLAAGEAFTALVAEQRRQSGEASGTFPGMRLGGLITDLAAAVRAAPVGGLTPWVEMPHGLFRFHVLARSEPEPHPYGEIEGQVRLDWIREKTEAWLAQETARLGAPAGAAFEPVLAAAAVEAGLDRVPTFLAAEEGFRRWWLADQAFYRDEQLWPDAARLRAARQVENEKLVRLRLLIAKVAAQGERAAALATAGQLADQLAGAERPAELLATAPARFAGVELEELGPVARDELRPLPLLHEAVEGLLAGAWRGPLPLPVDQIAPALEVRAYGPARDYRVLAFVAVLAREEPSDDELRRELMRQLRGQISTGTEAFLGALGARWQIELLPPLASP